MLAKGSVFVQTMFESCFCRKNMYTRQIFYELILLNQEFSIQRASRMILVLFQKFFLYSYIVVVVRLNRSCYCILNHFWKMEKRGLIYISFKMDKNRLGFQSVYSSHFRLLSGISSLQKVLIHQNVVCSSSNYVTRVIIVNKVSVWFCTYNRR